MPFIPLNTFTPSAPIEGCTNAENDRMEASLASLMLADLAIPYSADDATVAMMENYEAAGHLMENIARNNPSFVTQEVEDELHRVWADQFGKDIVAAGEARAKAAKR
jgi:hypothetical protein